MTRAKKSCKGRFFNRESLKGKKSSKRRKKELIVKEGTTEKKDESKPAKIKFLRRRVLPYFPKMSDWKEHQTQIGGTIQRTLFLGQQWSRQTEDAEFECWGNDEGRNLHQGTDCTWHSATGNPNKGE